MHSIFCQRATRDPMFPFQGGVIDDFLHFVYTLRPVHQAGTYPDDNKGIGNMLDLLHLGLRERLKVFDVELVWSGTQLD